MFYAAPSGPGAGKWTRYYSQSRGFRRMGHIAFNNHYAQLPDRFYSRLAPVPVPEPGHIRVNRELATELGIDPDWLASEAGTAIVAGNAVPEGADPIATVYAGHQFGGYNPQLGRRPRPAAGRNSHPRGPTF